MNRLMFTYIKPKNIFGFAIIYLFMIYLLMYLIDIRNIFNIQAYLDRAMKDAVSKVFWYQIFKEGGITELLQWFYLATSVLLCGMNWVK